MLQLDCSAVIFDLDGVLVDSTVCIQYHWQQWATKHKLDVGKVLSVAHGRRTVETIRLVAPHLDPAVEAAQLEADEAFDTNGVVNIEGATQLLHSLPRHQWAIATSGTRDTATTRINHTGLPMPDVLITAS
jgi:sugar-phosphatase